MTFICMRAVVRRRRCKYIIIPWLVLAVAAFAIQLCQNCAFGLQKSRFLAVKCERAYIRTTHETHMQSVRE